LSLPKAGHIILITAPLRLTLMCRLIMENKDRRTVGISKMFSRMSHRLIIPRVDLLCVCVVIEEWWTVWWWRWACWIWLHTVCEKSQLQLDRRRPETSHLFRFSAIIFDVYSSSVLLRPVCQVCFCPGFLNEQKEKFLPLRVYWYQNDRRLSCLGSHGSLLYNDYNSFQAAWLSYFTERHEWVEVTVRITLFDYVLFYSVISQV